MPSDAEYNRRLQELDQLPFNYDASDYAQDQPGWNHDSYRTRLPSESSGLPTEDGTFARAKNVLIEYRFPDPNRIKGHFDVDGPLMGRTMLLEGRLFWLTVEFGVRVVNVIDETDVDDDGNPITQFGYAYRTLQDHWEIGEITFLIEKQHNTGAVDFLIDAYSKPDRIPNVFYRVGFWFLGRRLQKQFANQCLKRMKILVQE